MFGGKTYALDNFRCLVSAMAARHGEFLHAGRFHTYSVNSGYSGRSDSSDSRPSTCLTPVLFLEVRNAFDMRRYYDARPGMLRSW